MIQQLLFLLLLPLALGGQEISLRENLAKAEPGHYLVTEQNKTYTFLHINENSTNRIVMEEVSIPAAKSPQGSMKWRDWFESGAPGHTSWIQSQINLTTGECEEAYSIPHQSWIDTTETSRFMATLLNLHFTETPSIKRRKIGPAPGYNKPDHRPLWHPRLIVDGNHHQNIPFQAWTAHWPADGSELSRKKVEVYLPDTTTQTYPTHFPYWLEVEGKLGLEFEDLGPQKLKNISRPVRVYRVLHTLYGEVMPASMCCTARDFIFVVLPNKLITILLVALVLVATLLRFLLH